MDTLSRRERYLQTAEARSWDITLENGYQFEPLVSEPGVFRLWRPVPNDHLYYRLDFYEADCICDCPGFEIYGACKHRIALLRAVNEAMNLLAPMLQLDRGKR